MLDSASTCRIIAFLTESESMFSIWVGALICPLWNFLMINWRLKNACLVSRCCGACNYATGNVELRAELAMKVQAQVLPSGLRLARRANGQGGDWGA